MKHPEPNKRDKILSAAFAALMKNGLPYLSHDIIADASGVSRQLIRYYFPDKEDLMIALCDHMALAYREAMVDAVVELEQPERLNYFLDFYFDLLAGQPKPRDDQAYDAMLSIATGSPRIRENLRGQYSLLGNVVAHEIAVSHPSLQQADADQISYLFISLMYGHWKMVATLGLSESHNIVARRAIDRLIASYLHKSSEPTERPRVWSLED